MTALRLNHLDLQVADVPATVALFERLFDLRCTSNPTSPALAFLTDGAGFTLVVQRKKHDHDAYPEDFHFGFLVEDVALVHRTRERALAAGVACSEVIVNNRGTMVYVRVPDGFLVEVGCREATARATARPSADAGSSRDP
jgi:catechol 2,3-dioxygenase-like lactoylglutathione lyase family enzyme